MACSLEFDPPCYRSSRWGYAPLGVALPKLHRHPCIHHHEGTAGTAAGSRGLLLVDCARHFHTPESERVAAHIFAARGRMSTVVGIQWVSCVPTEGYPTVSTLARPPHAPWAARAPHRTGQALLRKLREPPPCSHRHSAHTCPRNPAMQIIRDLGACFAEWHGRLPLIGSRCHVPPQTARGRRWDTREDRNPDADS